MNRVYFDNAATTPIHKKVVEVMTDSLTNIYGNPSSSHSYGREAKAQLEGSRRKIAQIIKAKPSEILFTSCGTESNNTILKNCINHLGVTRILTTPIEHPSIHTTVQNLSTQIKVEYLPIDERGAVIIEQLTQMLQTNTEKTLVSIMHANNEVGVMNDLKTIAKICKDNHAYIHSDMVQTMGHLDIDFNELLVDFASASAHKFHGPKGVGFLFVRNPIQLSPFITGGSQERGFRSGTENLASIVGMATALELATNHIEEDIKHLNSLRVYMMEELKKAIPDIGFITKMDCSLCTVLSVIFPPQFDCEMLLFQLDMKGIACSGGSACSSGANKASYVLAHFSIPTDRKVVRFSFSKFNKMDEIDFCVSKIKELVMETSS